MSMARSRSPSSGLVISALVLVQVLFGLNYAVSKGIVGLFPPLVWASMRIAIATVVILGVTLAMRRPHPGDLKKFFIPMIGLALLGTIINQASFLVGLRHTTATNSAVLNSLIPIFTLLIVTIRGQEKLSPRRAIGFLLALSGVLVIRKIETMRLSDETLLGDSLTILNCFSYACFLSFGKKFTESHDRLWTTTWLFIYGTVGITLLSLPEWRGFSFPAILPSMWASMIFSILGATLLTYFLNVWTLSKVTSSQVAIFIYLQPVVGAAFAWFWLSEELTFRTVLASVLIFMGMLLALESRRPRWWNRFRRASSAAEEGIAS